MIASNNTQGEKPSLLMNTKCIKPTIVLRHTLNTMPSQVGVVERKKINSYSDTNTHKNQ